MKSFKNKKFIILICFVFGFCIFGCQTPETESQYMNIPIEELYSGKKLESFVQLKVISVSDNLYYSDDEGVEYISLECEVIEDFYDVCFNGSLMNLLIELNEYKSFNKAKSFFLEQDYIIVYCKPLRKELVDENNNKKSLNNAYVLVLDSTESIIPIKENKVDLYSIKKIKNVNSSLLYKEYIKNKMSLENLKKFLREFAKNTTNIKSIESQYQYFSNSYWSLLKVESIEEDIYKNENGNRYIVANVKVIEDFYEKIANGTTIKLLVNTSNFKDITTMKSFLLEQEYIIAYFTMVDYYMSDLSPFLNETTNEKLTNTKVYYTYLENYLSIISINDNKVDLDSIKEVSIYSRDISDYKNFTTYINNGINLDDVICNLRLFSVKYANDNKLHITRAFQSKDNQSFAQLKIVNIDTINFSGDNTEYINLKCKVIDDFYEVLACEKEINLLMDLSEFKNFENAKEFFLKQEYIFAHFKLFENDDLYENIDKFYIITENCVSSVIPIKDGKVDFYSIKDTQISGYGFPYKKEIPNNTELENLKEILRKLFIDVKKNEGYIKE